MRTPKKWRNECRSTPSVREAKYPSGMIHEQHPPQFLLPVTGGQAALGSQQHRAVEIAERRKTG